jgi:hypothetical protein
MNAVLGLALRAWFLGLAVTALVVLPGVTALDGILTDPFLKTLPVRILVYFGMLLPSLLMTAIFGVLLSAPLFLLGLLTAFAFHRQIARHPLPFAALAPLLAVAVLALFSALVRGPDDFGQVTFLDYAWREALRADSLIVALPVAVGSFHFCLRLAKQERTGPP